MVLMLKLPKKKEKGNKEEDTNGNVSNKTKDNKDPMMNVKTIERTTKLVKHNKGHSKTRLDVVNIKGVLKKTKKTIKKAIKGQKKQKKVKKDKKPKKTKKNKSLKKTD